MDETTTARLAELAIGFGANLQPGQNVAINGEPGKEHLVRALAESAYKHGARFVDVGWFDPWVKRARIQHAAEDTLDFVPPWYGERVLALGDHRAARVALSGPSAPGRGAACPVEADVAQDRLDGGRGDRPVAPRGRRRVGSGLGACGPRAKRRPRRERHPLAERGDFPHARA